MKQESISYMSTIKDEFFSVSDFILNHGEESYKEKSTCEFLTTILRKHNFTIEKDCFNIPHSFTATLGSGYPKIAFTCDYDVSKEYGDVLCHHVGTSMVIGTAITLSNIMSSFKTGTLIIVGCSGELKGGSKAIMTKEGLFNDIDLVMDPCPHVVSAEGRSSMASLPIEINYKARGNYFKAEGTYSPLDAAIFSLNGINTLINSFSEECYLNGLSMTSPVTPHIAPMEFKITFYIKARKMDILNRIEEKIREFVDSTSNLLNVDGSIHYHEMPSHELITSPTLSRLFSHNLKESGIIDIDTPRDTHLSLSLGSVSRTLPTIRPFISICEDQTIDPYSSAFLEASKLPYCRDQILKAIQAFTSTSIDLFEREDLIREIISEYNIQKTDKC